MQQNSYVRVEVDLPPDAAEKFSFLLAEVNAVGPQFTPSELAASLIISILDDEASHPVDLRSLDS